MTNEALPPEPKPIGEILEDVEAIVASQADPTRAHEVARIDLSHEIAALEAERDIIAESIRGGNADPGLRIELDRITKALLSAQADEIDTRGNQGNQ